MPIDIALRRGRHVTIFALGWVFIVGAMLLIAVLAGLLVWYVPGLVS